MRFADSIWSGVLIGLLAITYIELPQWLLDGYVPPLPFLALYASVVLASHFFGFRTGIVSGGIASGFICYAWLVAFGPATLTGGPVQVMMGTSLFMFTAYSPGRTKKLKDGYLAELESRKLQLAETVHNRTHELMVANNKLEVVIAERQAVIDQLQFHKFLFDNVSDAILATATDFNINAWNTAAEKIYQLSGDELNGKRVTDIIPMEYLNDNRESVLETFRKNGKWRGSLFN